VRLGNSSASSPFISNITQQSRQLYTTDINGANPKLYFKDQLNTPSFSLNDERILGVLEYQDENNSTPGRQLISIAKDGKAYTLSDPFLAASSYITGASSNQKVFYYQYRVGGDNSSRTVEYFITDPKGEKRLRLSTRPGELKGFIWSPDNRHALVASQLDQNLIRFSLVNLENGSEAEIWRGSPTSQLIMGNSTFSPDGKWLAYELVPSSSSSGSSSSSSASRLLRTASIYLVNLENGRYDRQEFMRGAHSLVWSGR
jgi:Tol biopolymer transport system component